MTVMPDPSTRTPDKGAVGPSRGTETAPERS